MDCCFATGSTIRGKWLNNVLSHCIASAMTDASQSHKVTFPPLHEAHTNVFDLSLPWVGFLMI